MRIVKKPDNYEYEGTCNKCKAVLEACSYELDDFDDKANDARGKCPLCFNHVIFKKTK